MSKVRAEILALEQKLAVKVGPRGGKIIGKTKSGKPIYDTNDHEAHKGFSAEDHHDAWAAHAGKVKRLGDRNVTPKNHAEIMGGMDHHFAHGNEHLLKHHEMKSDEAYKDWSKANKQFNKMRKRPDGSTNYRHEEANKFYTQNVLPAKKKMMDSFNELEDHRKHMHEMSAPKKESDAAEGDWYNNHYHCDDCNEDWETEGDSMHDDECPSCGKDHSPHKSDKLS